MPASRDYKLMGIVNVTPDSFSDGGHYFDPRCAIDHAITLFEQGADILDIGGESTRPGARTVSVQEEIDRVCPVIEAIKGIDADISIDTRNAKTMDAALKAGANIINDVTALEGDDAKYEIAKGAKQVCLMHMQGEPQTMQEAPVYDDVVSDVYKYLSERIDACIRAGLLKGQLCVDPGIGFGKTLEHNLQLIAGLEKFSDLGVAVLLGTSRKSFIAKIDEGADTDHRLGGSLASVIYGYQHGARIFRVHDVAQTRQALDVHRYISLNQS